MASLEASRRWKANNKDRVRQYFYDWYHRNKEHMHGLQKKYRSADEYKIKFNTYKRTRRMQMTPEDKQAEALYHRKNNLKQKYKLTLEGYNQLLEKQNGVCAICSKRKKYKLCVDHDHVTGKIRGLLCVSCNRALAQFGDDADGVIRVLDYLCKDQWE